MNNPLKIACINLAGNGYHERFLYSDSMPQVRLTQEGIDAVKSADAVRIMANIYSQGDILDLLLLHDAITSVSSALVVVVIPYLPFGRADRRFKEGDCAGLEVFRKILRDIPEIVTLDAHNAKATWGITSVSPDSFIRSAIVSAAGDSSAITVLFPDKGARERYSVPAKLGNNHREISLSVAHCEKVRDAVTGKLSHFEVPDIDLASPAIIIDDICDGGGTFTGIADVIYERVFLCSLSLYVTHGIFSNGFNRLQSSFAHIYTTDTRRPTGPAGFLTVYDTAFELSRNLSLENVTT